MIVEDRERSVCVRLDVGIVRVFCFPLGLRNRSLILLHLLLDERPVESRAFEFRLECLVFGDVDPSRNGGTCLLHQKINFAIRAGLNVIELLAEVLDAAVRHHGLGHLSQVRWRHVGIRSPLREHAVVLFMSFVCGGAGSEKSAMREISRVASTRP